MANSAFTLQGATPLDLNKALSSGGLKLNTPLPTSTVAPRTSTPVSQGTTPGLFSTAPKPSTPVKSQTSPDGTKVEYHAPPKAVDPTSNAERVIDSGQQSGQEQQATQQLYNAGQATPMEQYYADRVTQAQGFKNVGTLAPFAEAGLYSGQNPNADALVTQPDLAARGSATQGLYNNLSNIYGSQATQGLLAANTIAGRGLTAAQGALSGAQTTANRGLIGNTTVLNASLPGQQGTSSTLYNPLGGAAGGTSVANGANRQSVYDLTQQANQIQSVFNGAEANFKLLVDTAKQGGVNDTNIPAINAIQQAVQKGLTSSSAVINFQNTLATVRSQYAQILGGGTSTVDSQQRAEQAIPPTISLGALQSLEQQLKAEATNRVAGINQQISTLSNPTSSGGSSGGSMFGSFFGR